MHEKVTDLLLPQRKLKTWIRTSTRFSSLTASSLALVAVNVILCCENHTRRIVNLSGPFLSARFLRRIFRNRGFWPAQQSFQSTTSVSFAESSCASDYRAIRGGRTCYVAYNLLHYFNGWRFHVSHAAYSVSTVRIGSGEIRDRP